MWFLGKREHFCGEIITFGWWMITFEGPQCMGTNPSQKSRQGSDPPSRQCLYFGIFCSGIPSLIKKNKNIKDYKKDILPTARDCLLRPDLEITYFKSTTRARIPFAWIFINPYKPLPFWNISKSQISIYLLLTMILLWSMRAHIYVLCYINVSLPLSR